jgi:hypothetical protein
MHRSLFLPRNGAERPAAKLPPAKRAKKLAVPANGDASHSTDIMDLGDEDEAANDANDDSLIERLVEKHSNNVSRQHFRETSQVFSPTPKEEENDDFKKSSSLDFGLGANLMFGDPKSIKQERSNSPDFEIVGSRSLPTYIDLTTDGVVIDLTQEDEPEG